jgi:N-acetylglucosaminyldiphosphoundecaprenol N-acetyl-beta-D-mannosaminyltransferase
MGVPLQEEFLIDLRDTGWTGTGYTCGGFFHQSARKLEYYPRLFDKLQLRWLYRMIQEPRLAKRYLLDYPKFVFIFIWDYIQWRIYRLQGKEQ